MRGSYDVVSAALRLGSVVLLASLLTGPARAGDDEAGALPAEITGEAPSFQVESAAATSPDAWVEGFGPPGDEERSSEFAMLRLQLDADDEVATLQAVQFALDEVGDGSSYVWHRTRGPLRGIVRPLQSFRAADGGICRHVSVSLSLGGTTREARGTACRGSERKWLLVD